MWQSYISVLILTLCASVWAIDLPDISKFNVNDIQTQLPAEFQNSNLTLQDAQILLKKKCVEASGGNLEEGDKAYREIENGSAVLMQCLNTIVNYTALQEEIEQAKPHGELDAVFHKYCGKRPAALTCIENFNTKLVPCLDKDEQQNKDVLMRIIKSLLAFVCHKGGDQIALFIAEKGPECLSSQKDNIQKCFNDTFSGYLPKDGDLEQFKARKMPKFIMGEQQCEELQVVETCIVNHLEKCSDITPANIIESMFRFIRNETICRNASKVTSAKHTSNGEVQLMGNVLLLVLTLGFLHLLAKQHKFA